MHPDSGYSWSSAALAWVSHARLLGRYSALLSHEKHKGRRALIPHDGVMACCMAALGLQAACRLLHTHLFCNDRESGLSRERNRIPAWVLLPMWIYNPKIVRDIAFHGPAMPAQPS